MKKATKPTTRAAGTTSKAKATAEKKALPTANAKETAATANAKETTAKKANAKTRTTAKTTTAKKKAVEKTPAAKKKAADKTPAAKKKTMTAAVRAVAKRDAHEETTPMSVAPPTEAPATEPLPPSPPSEPPLSQANTVVAGRAVHEEIRQLEAELDRMIDEASRRDVSTLLGDDEDDAPRPRPSGPIVEPRRPAEPTSEPTVFETARELLTTDFYLRKWGRLAMRNRSEEVDDFGHDPTYEARVRPLLDFLYHTYFRVECTGIEHVPAAGRCLLVANHSGTVPLDGLMLRTAIRREQEPSCGPSASAVTAPGQGRGTRQVQQDANRRPRSASNAQSGVRIPARSIATSRPSSGSTAAPRSTGANSADFRRRRLSCSSEANGKDEAEGRGHSPINVRAASSASTGSPAASLSLPSAVNLALVEIVRAASLSGSQG